MHFLIGMNKLLKRLNLNNEAAPDITVQKEFITAIQVFAE